MIFNSKNSSIKRRILILLVPILFQNQLSGQQELIDSLKSTLNSLSGKEKINTYNIIAETYGRSYAERIKYSQLALQLSEAEDYDEGIARSKGNLGLGFYFMGKYDEAAELYRESLEINKKLENDSLTALSYHRLGNSFQKLGENDSAIKYYKKASDLREIVSDKLGFLYSSIAVGVNYWRQSKYDSAISYYSKSLEAGRELGDKKAVARILNNIGVIYWQWADYHKALKFYLDSYSIREEIQDTSGMAVILCNIGMIYQKWDEDDKARENYDKALLLVKSTRFSIREAYALYSIGALHEKNGLPDSALTYYIKSLEIYRNSDTPAGYVMNLIGIGKAYSEKGNFRRAISNLNEAVQIADTLDNQEKKASAIHEIAHVYFSMGEYSKASASAKESLIIAEKINQTFLIGENYHILSELNKKRGNFRGAYDYHVLYKEVSDSIFSIEKSRQITAMHAEAETEKKERENTLLRQKNEFQKTKSFYQTVIFFSILLLFAFFALFFYFRFKYRQKAIDMLRGKNSLITEQKNKLEELNITKDKLFSIIAHDLKNPFSSIMSFIQLYKDDEDLTNENRREIIGHIESSTKKTYAMLENLLKWAQIQLGKVELNEEEIALIDIVYSAIEPYNHFAEDKEIKISIQIDDNQVIKADQYLLQTVIGNIVYNSIKFSNPGGEIKIDFIPNNGESKITITDNGIGMDEKTLSNLFKINESVSRTGTKNEQGSGLGLVLCKEFLNKAGWDIGIESESGKGTRVSLRFSS